LLNAYAFNWTQGAIASAINSKFAAYVRASAPAPGAGMAGGVAAVLVGGLDPEIIGAQYKYPTVASPGLFHFDQPQCYVVTQVEGMFTGLTPTPTEVFVDVINLDEGLEPIVDEWAPIYCSQLDSANPGFTVTDVKCQLHTFRALRVRMAAPGVVRVQVRREAPQPMI
jgi:hypothetical protein